MFCFKCGAPLAQDALFCEHCGTRLQNQPAQQPTQQPTYQQPAYQQPAYQQPAYQQPAYQQPAYQQPVYQQPAYQQSAYQQPVYQAPVQQPVYPNGASQLGSGVSTAVNAAKGGASALKWILIAAALIGVLVFVVFQFDLLNIFKSDEDLIRERVEAFEEAYNNTDWDGILDCLDYETRMTMELTMSFAEGLMGEAAGMDISMSDMFAMSGMFIEGDYCTIEILDIQIDGDYAMVTVEMSVELYDMSQSETATLPMVKEGNDWYISGMMGY